MKRYKITYLNGNRSKPDCFAEISKSGKYDGVGISFWSNGKKDWQAKFKNDLRNGLEKIWMLFLQWNNPKDYIFQNWKNHKTQGIQIKSKR